MIIQSLQSGGKMRIAHLAELSGASEVTIRRDLAVLEGRGALRRVPGGAVRTVKDGGNISCALRMDEDHELKGRLAEAATQLVFDYESVIIDNGTTCCAVARELSGRPITALCLSLHAAVALGSEPGSTILVPGGPVEPDDLAFVGSQALEAVRGLRADVAILGACSASAGAGLTAARYEDSLVKKASIATSERRILVTTSDKLTRRSNFRFGEPADLTHLVTTQGGAPDVLALFEESGVEVIEV